MRGLFAQVASVEEKEKPSASKHAHDAEIRELAVIDRIADAWGTKKQEQVFQAEYANAEKISIDYAVAERTSKAAVVPADLGWSDVGSWSALWELGGKDTAGNVSQGDVVLEGAENCYVRSDGVLTAVVGLKDAVVVVTKDAVLAMDRAQAQDVKKVVDELSGEGAARMFGKAWDKVDRRGLAFMQASGVQSDLRAVFALDGNNLWVAAGTSVLATATGGR